MYIDPNEQRLQATNEVCLATIEFQTALLAFTQLHGSLINKDNYSLAISRTSSTFGKGVSPKMAILSFYENLSKSLQELQKQYLEGVKFNVKWSVDEEKESFTRTSSDGDLTFVVKKHGEWGWMLCVNNHPIGYFSDQETAMAFSAMIDLSVPKQEIIKKSLYDKVIESMKESEAPEKVNIDDYWKQYADENSVKVAYVCDIAIDPVTRHTHTLCIYQEKGLFRIMNLDEPKDIINVNRTNLNRTIHELKENSVNSRALDVVMHIPFFIESNIDDTVHIARHPLKEDLYYIFKNSDNLVVDKEFVDFYRGTLKDLKEKLTNEAKKPQEYEKVGISDYWIPYGINDIESLYKFYSQPFPDKKDQSNTICVYQDSGFYFSFSFDEPNSLKSFYNSLDKCLDFIKEVRPNGSFLPVTADTSFFILKSSDDEYFIAEHPIEDDTYYLFRRADENNIHKIFVCVFNGTLQKLKEKFV